VLPSSDIERDVSWYTEKTGFALLYKDEMYAVLIRDERTIHLQWHADTTDDPLLGGSVIRISVGKIEPILNEFVNRGTVAAESLRRNTPWNTHEFGFYDLNRNAIFIVQDLS
jgi:hypothetical protein